MKFSLQCPACDGRIPLYRRFLAISPSHIKCHHCRSSLVAKRAGWLFFLNFLVIGTVITAYLTLYKDYLPGHELNLLIPIGLVLFMDFLNFVIVCNRKKVEIIIKKNRYIENLDEVEEIE